MAFRLEALKRDVIYVLKKYPDGLMRNDIWEIVTKLTGRETKARMYGLAKMSRVFEMWKDCITVSGQSDNARIFLKPNSELEQGIGGDDPAADKPPVTAMSLMAEIQIQKLKTRRDSHGSYDNDGAADANIDEEYNLLVNYLPVVKTWILEHLGIPRREGFCKLSSLRLFLKTKLREQFGVQHLRPNTLKKLINEQCADTAYLKRGSKKFYVYLRTVGEPGNIESEAATAMSLMSSMSQSNDSLPKQYQKRSHRSHHAPKTVPSSNMISLVDDEEKKSDVIDLTENKEIAKNSIFSNQLIGRFGSPATSSIQFGTPAITPMPAPDSKPHACTSKFGSFSVPAKLLQPAADVACPTGLPMQLGSGGIEKSEQHHGVIPAAPCIPHTRKRNDPAMPGFRDQVIDLTVKPIDMQEFERKNVEVRPVYVQRGGLPPRDQVEAVARECIDMLSEANELVTQERLEQFVCQRFNAYNMKQIGISYMDQLPSIIELNRILGKINAYLLTFVKTRSICTLHELKICLQDYAQGQGDFSLLRVGPLQRFPLVYQYFRFPPDMAAIPEITSMEVLDHFHNYMSQNNLWTKRLELEPFMEYLVQEYSANSAYQLGVRIRSLPLLAAVLKKAQRDAGSNHRQILEHFKLLLKNEVGDAFRKFRANILEASEGEGMAVRQHYMKTRPESVIMEVLEKFNVLLMVAQVGDRKTLNMAKLRRVIEEFLMLMKDDDLAKNIFHLALSMSNISVEEKAMELLIPVDEDSDGDSSKKSSQNKPPPRKDALLCSLKTYIERCLNAGALALTHLERIEGKLLEEFGFTTFNAMGYGRFLEFVLTETKQMLEESGGMLLGSGSGFEGDSSFKPHQADLLEFTKQCRQCGLKQPDEIEAALCKQYSVKEVRHLGYGNIARLLSYADKHSRHTYGESTVCYESTLVQPSGLPASSGSKVGILGYQSRDSAKICLHNCPMLENMANWCQWGLVFEPEHGKLKEFVQKYGGVTTKSIDGGRKLATLDFLALELKPGELIKVVSSTSPECVATALENRDVQATAGHLVSMAVAYKGVVNMPHALLSGHVKTALLQIHAEDSSSETTDKPVSLPEQHKAAMFVLQCLLHIPTNICVSLANQIFLEPLGQVVGSSKSKQLLVELCQPEKELNQLIELGCLLGIQEWTDMIQNKCKLSGSALQLIPPDVEEFLENDREQDEEDVLIIDDEAEDVDEILAGDIGKAKVKITDKNAEDTKNNDVTSVENIDEDVVMVDKSSQNEAADSCIDIINEIRRDEFGVGVHLGEDGQRLMRIQQERLGRSLDRLSKDLYSKDTHFVLELIQNADDNSYHDYLLSNTLEDCSAVKFVIDNDGIYVFNNELGFKETNIRALCDVGRSTKGKHKFGYIGQKGIGFKSVFRVTDCPEVHSNGYHIKFDVGSGPMGYILPHWVPEQERTSQDDWMTHIILKLKPDMRVQARTLAARFNDIHPSLLLFLHRLRQITIENKIENGRQTMRRHDVGNNVVEIRHSHGCERWLVIKKMLDARKIPLQAKSGADVESTELALAFPLRQQGLKGLESVHAMPPKQPVFAFLPLRSYGFRFIVQGDFDVPSSREDVDRDSSWNQWLRNEIHTVFIDALEIFKSQHEFSSVEAACAFLQFVPMEDEVLDFFKPVASDILKKLRAKPCVPTQPNSQGVVNWKMPSQTVRVRDPLVRTVITAEVLQTHLNLFYLHCDVAAMLNPTLTSCLGIETLTSEHLFQLGKALIVSMGTHCSVDEEVVVIAKWMACMYRSLDEFHHDDAILTTLRSQRLLPLSDGELVALHDKTVFYPITSTNTKRQIEGKDTMYYLQHDVDSIHPMLLNTDDDEVNSQVHKLLVRLGIKQLSPFDLINHHIIPVLKDDGWQSKSRGTLLAYLVYIKEQTDKDSSVCNLDEVKDVAVLLTNYGFKKPSKEPVHFPAQYGNQVKLREVFTGYDWNLLDVGYLPQTCSQPMVVTWHEFFTKLGVEDFLSIKRRDVCLKREDLASSQWDTESSLWPEEEQEFTVQDYTSVELDGLILNNKYPSGESYAEQMKHLCIYLDRHWEDRFSKYCVTRVLDKYGTTLKDTATSFSILLRTAQWLPAVETETKPDLDGSLICDLQITTKKASCLYVKCDDVQQLLSDKVYYLNMKLSGGSFHTFLGIKNTVEMGKLKEYLLKWSVRGVDNCQTVFCTSLQHMKNVYAYLGKELKRQEFQDLLREQPIFFVPDKSATYIMNSDEVVPGKMLNRNEIWFMDKTGLFDKHRLILEEFKSNICRKRTIAGFYNDRPEILELFKLEGKLDVRPKVEEYIELLCLLCSTSTPKELRVVSDVLYIFTTIGQELLATPEGMPDEPTANMVVDVLKTTVKKKLENKKVLPTSKGTWVSVDDHPMIPDNREWEKMFINKPGVHFLDMEDHTMKQNLKRGTNKDKRSKGTACHIQLDKIDVVMEVLGIKKLSMLVDIRPTPDLIEPCPELQAYFCQILPVIQPYLMSRFEDVYQQLEIMETKEMLTDAKFYRAGKLEVSYWLTNMTEETFVICTEKCVIHAPTFYVHQDYVSCHSEINREVARYFSNGDLHCNTSLRSFLSELSAILSGSTNDTVDALLQRHAADGVEIPDDEDWEVQVPAFTELDIPDKSEIEGTFEREGQEVPELVIKKGEEFSAIRNWSLAAGILRDYQTRDKDDRPPGSVAWPSSQTREYRQSLKSLPSNIRVTGDAEKFEEKAEKGEGEVNEMVEDSGEVTDQIEGVLERKRKRRHSENEEDIVKKHITSLDREDLARYKMDPGEQSKEEKQQPSIKGNPIWSYMATEYTYDELGSGVALATGQTVALNDEAGDPEIGLWGESVVAHYLEKQKERGNISDYKWLNSDEETGCPYDFEVYRTGEYGAQMDYIEVKSTASNDKSVFEISVQQIKFADEKKNFHIYRVFNAGSADRVRLIRITDLDMRLSTKQVKLCMFI